MVSKSWFFQDSFSFGWVSSLSSIEMRRRPNRQIVAPRIQFNEIDSSKMRKLPNPVKKKLKPELRMIALAVVVLFSKAFAELFVMVILVAIIKAKNAIRVAIWMISN
mmetsp:Transcript_40091/g.63398  ORF Transcript_40091/g.63398 Transcript_40091/m.63398 type:complete len:107 (+) Transcript_40091:92-412(+)